MSRFVRAADLPTEDVARQDFYDLVENAKPSADLVDGIMLVVESDKIVAGAAIPQWRKFTIGHAAITSTGVVHEAELFASGALGIVHAVVVNVRNYFVISRTPLEVVTLSIGISGAEEKYMAKIGTGTAFLHDLSNVMKLSESDTVNAYFRVLTGNISDISAGAIDIHVLYSEMPA